MLLDKPVNGIDQSINLSVSQSIDWSRLGLCRNIRYDTKEEFNVATEKLIYIMESEEHKNFAIQCLFRNMRKTGISRFD